MLVYKIREGHQHTLVDKEVWQLDGRAKEGSVNNKKVGVAMVDEYADPDPDPGHFRYSQVGQMICSKEL